MSLPPAPPHNAEEEEDDEKQLRREARAALAARTKYERRYFEAVSELHIRYGDTEYGERIKTLLKPRSTAGKGARKGAAKKEEERKQKKQKKVPEKKKSPVNDDAADWTCAGNVITGTPCLTPNSARAPDTRWQKKQYPSCKNCKKDIRDSKP